MAKNKNRSVKREENEDMGNLSEADINKAFPGTSFNTEDEAGISEKKAPSIVRNRSIEVTPENIERQITIIGTGDGGANIASKIKEDVGLKTIIYNTSKRSIVDRLSMDKFIHPGGEDGSGKVRSYSKDVFKSGAHKTLEGILKENPESKWAYNIIISTTDGGTGGGVSPNVAKYAEAVTGKPTIIVGVYPTLNEDARSQFNALSWQADVEKTELPYMAFDNNSFASESNMVRHEKINAEVSRAIHVFSGKLYGESDSLDNQDFAKLISRGGRICIYSSDRDLRVNESLDNYIFEMISTSSQPIPVEPEAYGLFVKGPKEMLENLDTNMTEVFHKFGGTSRDIHLEESNDVCISLIITGCGPASNRLKTIKKRYDDLMSPKKSTQPSVNTLLDGLQDPSQVKGLRVSTEDDALNI